MNENNNPTNAATYEISSRILRAIAESGSIRAGYDAVMGNGAYDKNANELYAAIRAAIKTIQAVQVARS